MKYISYTVLFVTTTANYKLSVKKTQNIILEPNFLSGMGAPQIFLAPGLAVLKTATDLHITNSIPPYYWWYLSTKLMVSPDNTEHRPMYSWYPTQFWWYPHRTEHSPMYWISSTIVHRRTPGRYNTIGWSTSQQLRNQNQRNIIRTKFYAVFDSWFWFILRGLKQPE